MLIPEDEEFLRRKGWRYDLNTVDLPGNSKETHVILREFPLPERYSPRQVDLLVRIPPGYPEAGLDMFWTRPDVTFAATNQKPPATDVYEEYGGLTWQRWSRHLFGWRPDKDNLETFFAVIQKELT